MIIIGEKINGFIPQVGKAIAARDAEFIKDLAVKQTEAGVDYLDVCASCPEDEELETIEWLIELVQSVSDVPICIDSSNPECCVAAMSFCKKEGMINSVSMEGKKIDAIFPAIAKSGWKCVALLCDDKGIPSDVSTRFTLCSRIADKAKEYDIPISRLFFDPLVTTLGTDGESLSKFVETTAKIKTHYPDAHITSGLSNVSFGLPNRVSINQAFLALAMNAGMDSAIVDPCNGAILGIILATDALLQNDEYCLDYIGAYRKGRIGSKK